MDMDEFITIVGSLFVIGMVGILLVAIMSPIPMIKYGNGATYGVMTTIEEGIFYDRVWIRADYESSQTDAYCISKNSDLQQKIKNLIKSKQRVEMNYNIYWIGQCELVTSVSGIGE